MTISQAQWDQHKAEIYHLYYQLNYPIRDVIDIMKNKGFKASKAGYFRQFQRWGDAPEKKSTILSDEKLENLVRRLWQENMDHKNILRALQQFEGYPEITDWQLRELRRKNKLIYRRNHGLSEAEVLDALNTVRSELESGQAAQWGVRSIQGRLRQIRQGSFIPRSHISSIMRQLDSHGLENRRLDRPRRRRRYFVKGPNRVWSVDGHDKLAAYGFQIYGIMDAYSRMMLGVFVGNSNRTQIAVLKYYLRTIKKFGFPKLVRSDKGAETILMAACHIAFRRTAKATTLDALKAWGYGTSTKNQRIERWWRALIDQQIDQWIAYFDELKGRNLFDSSKYDRIALQFLYMETIRNHIDTFVEMYNSHSIRKQVQRDWYLPSGKPNQMFKYPADGVRNYAGAPDPELLKYYESQLEWYDDTKYLLEETRDLCGKLLTEAGVAYNVLNPLLPGLDQPHVEAYKALRTALYEWESSGNGVVEELQPPIGAISLIEREAARCRADMEALETGREARVSRIIGGEISEDDSSGDDGDDNTEDARDDAGDGDNVDDGLFYEPPPFDTLTHSTSE